MSSEMVERIARAIWSIRREDEDRCDMELEDMGRRHSVWCEALAAMKAMREPTTGMLGAAQAAWLHDPERRTSTLYRAMIDHEIKLASDERDVRAALHPETHAPASKGGARDRTHE